jgi:hypothetical protein
LSVFWNPPTNLVGTPSNQRKANQEVRERRLREKLSAFTSPTMTEARLWIKEEDADIKAIVDLLRFSTLRTFRLGFSSRDFLNKTDRDASMKSLLAICHAFQHYDLDTVGLEMHLRIDHRTKEIDICVNIIFWLIQSCPDIDIGFSRTFFPEFSAVAAPQIKSDTSRSPSASLLCDYQTFLVETVD